LPRRSAARSGPSRARAAGRRCASDDCRLERAIEPLLTNIKRIAVVTTYGSPTWLLWYIGRIDRKLVGRGIRRLCARDCKVEWVTLTRMDHRTREECATFIGKVRRHFARW